MADYMIYTANWRIVLEDDDTENYRIVNDNHSAEETITLTNSLLEFLNRYVIGDGALSDNGLYTWREEKLRSGGLCQIKSMSEFKYLGGRPCFCRRILCAI